VIAWNSLQSSLVYCVDMGRFQLGEFEQRVLLAVLRAGDDAPPAEVRRELARLIERDVSRGAFYTTLERLEAKGLLTWDIRRRAGAGELPDRRLAVTQEGLAELRAARRSMLDMWRGLEPLLDKVRK
jgi:PadR family transcriptional regulator, regulatory protein PadR